MVGLEIYNSCHREHLKPLIGRSPLVTVIVKVWTMWFVAAISMLTDVELVELRMVFLFFPPRTIWAHHSLSTPLFVFINGFLRAPVAALIFFIQR